MKKLPLIYKILTNAILDYEDREFFIGDLEELYNIKMESGGILISHLWIMFHFIISVPPIVIDNIIWSIDMLKSYLVATFRNILNNKGYAFLNITGLAIGLACSILVYLYIKYEFSFDQYHENAENIYRIVMEQPGNLYNGTEWWYVSPYILKPTVEKDFPEVINCARIIDEEKVITYENNKFAEKKFFYADPEFLQMFTFPMLEGNLETALSEPFSIVLTLDMAFKYFGDENPIGKTLSLNDGFDYKVTGVLQNIPLNSHFSFDFLGSFASLYTLRAGDSDWLTNWFNNPFKTFVQLPKNYDPEIFDAKLLNYSFEAFGGNIYDFHTQPLTDIHLEGNANGEIEPNRDINMLYIFGAVALFILIIACSNYINLSTARSATRTMEVGIRKIVGANKKQLITQFIGEAVVYSIIALLIAIIFAVTALPYFSELLQSKIELSLLFDPVTILLMIAITILIGLIAGYYPAFSIVTLLNKNNLLGKKTIKKQSPFTLRNGLVLIQFIIAIVLIISTIVTTQQLNYMRNKKLGYQKDHILTLKLKDWNFIQYKNAFKNELLKHKDIIKVSSSMGLPNDIGSSNIPKWEGQNENEQTFFYRLPVDNDFIDLYGLEIIHGNSFRESNKKNEEKAYILNESAIKLMAMEDPIGKRFGFWELNGTIVGVVKDFHFMSLDLAIQPLGLVLDGGFDDISIKISSNDIENTIAYIKSVWDNMFPSYPFDYSFLDDTVDRMYKAEQSLAEGFQIFACIAIFIACMGLLGLVSYSVQLRVKEIGIRKVLGSSVSSIVFLLSGDLLKWILVANVIAYPIAYWIMLKWLQGFAYRVNINTWIFLISGISTIIFAFATISYQSIKAAKANPVDSLKYE